MSDERNAGCAKCTKYRGPMLVFSTRRMSDLCCYPETSKTWDPEYGYEWDTEDFSKNAEGACPLFELRKDPVREANNRVKEKNETEKRQITKVLIVIVIAVLAALLAVLTLTSCTEEPCETENALRCDGTDLGKEN